MAMKPAILYQKKDKQGVQCELCNHFCQIRPGHTGICRVRQNINGELFSLNYGKVIAQHIDPIEKKPLRRFLPHSFTYSISSIGCNFRCLHCHNWDISQADNRNLLVINDSLPEIAPEEIIKEAIRHECPSISYTYTEPTVFAEFALDCMKLAKKKKLKNIWVSNGYMSPKCLELVAPYLDAANIDLKAFKDETYHKVCGAKLQPVLDNLIWLKQNKIHLEVTTLIIPTINDSADELKQIADFIFDKLGADTPWHVSAFYPANKLIHLPITPTKKVLEAREIGEQMGLKYVFG